MGAKQSINIIDLLSKNIKHDNILQNIQEKLSSYFIADIINIIIEYVNGNSPNNYLWYSKEEYEKSYNKQLYKYVIFDNNVIYYLHNIQNIKLYIYNLSTEKEIYHNLSKQYHRVLKFLKDGDNLFIIQSAMIYMLNIVITNLRNKQILDIKNNVVYHTSNTLPIINNDFIKLKFYNITYYYNRITKQMSKTLHLPASIYNVIKPNSISINENEILRKEFKKNIVMMYIFNSEKSKSIENIKLIFDKFNVVFKINILNFNCYEIMFEIDYVYSTTPLLIEPAYKIRRYICVYDRLNKKIHRSTPIDTIYDCRVSNDKMIYFSDNKIFLYKRIL
jgi:hypothetical protein